MVFGRRESSVFFCGFDNDGYLLQQRRTMYPLKMILVSKVQQQTSYKQPDSTKVLFPILILPKKMQNTAELLFLHGPALIAY